MTKQTTIVVIGSLRVKKLVKAIKSSSSTGDHNENEVYIMSDNCECYSSSDIS